MVLTPNTIGLMLLLVAVFLGCILWATRGHTATHGTERDMVDYQHGLSKPS